jgi:3-octaprenyl-4-hydroxybenzoate carboxy-lyase C-terminal domain
MEKLGNALWGTHYGHTAMKVLVGSEDIDPTNPVSVSWAFATRNHTTQGCFYFPNLQSVGIGPESCNSMADFNALLIDHDELPKGNSIVIYSCIGLKEHMGRPKPDILTFHRSYPKAVK